MLTSDSDVERSVLQAILGSVNDAVTVVDTAGTVIYWNSVAEEIYGIRQSEIIGRKIGQFFQRGSLMLFQVMETQKPVSDVYHSPRPDKHVFITSAPIHDSQGRLIGAISVEQDVTRLVKMSEIKYEQLNGDNALNIIPKFTGGELTLSKMVDLAAAAVHQTVSYPFLFVGEAGVGKQTCASYIHQASRRPGPFLVVPCHLLSPGLVDLELFGFDGDTFTTNQPPHVGKLESAAAGTVFLMNIHTLPTTTQFRLAEALRNQSFERLGRGTSVPLQCQVIASAGPNIADDVAAGQFSPDLFYGSQLVHFRALRERQEDLPGLCKLFLEKLSAESGKSIPRLSSDVIAAIVAYAWPGNLPELRSFLQYLFLTYDGRQVELTDLPAHLRPRTLNDVVEHDLSLQTVSADVEEQKIRQALDVTKGNKAGAAKLLGISRGTLYYKMKRHGM